MRLNIIARCIDVVHSLFVIGSISDCLEPKKWLPWNRDVTLYHSTGAWHLFKISAKRRGKEGGLIERALIKFSFQRNVT